MAQPWTGGDAQQVLVHVVIDSDNSHASLQEPLRAAGTEARTILRVGFSPCLITPTDGGSLSDSLLVGLTGEQWLCARCAWHWDSRRM